MDAGNLLFKKGDTGDNPLAMITAHGIVRAYSKMSYDAVAVSPQDMNAGLDFFKVSMEKGFPWISANIVDDQGRLIFPATAIIKRAGAAAVGIIGLTGKIDHSSSWAQIGDWRETLFEHLTQLKSTCGVLIILSNLSDDENREIAENYPQADIIITSSPTRYGNQTPQIVDDSLITQADGRGKYLGKLEIKWHPSGSWQTTSPADSQKRLQEKLVALDGQLQEYHENKDGNQKDDGLLMKLVEHKKSIESQLNSFVEQNQEPVFANTFDATFLPVRPQSSGDEVDTIVRDINKSVGAYQKARLKQNGQIDQRTGEVLQLEKFTGVDTCKSCHERQSAFWTKTAHAEAFATLVKNGQSYNPECLPCHVTGGNISPVSSYAEKDLLLVLPENRQVVGCETCHGQGRQHSQSPVGSHPPVRKPAERKCFNCHTPEHDDNFDYQRKIIEIACPPGK